MARSRSVLARLTVAMTAVLVVAVPALPSAASSAGVNDGGVVAKAAPFKYTPNFADGAVKALVQVGQRMIVGGSFTSVSQVTTAGTGAATARKFLLAFNPTTGALDTGFKPVVNGEVDTIQPTADGTGVYVAGRFSTAGGATTKLALFKVSTGQLVATFKPVINGPINDLALVGNHLLVGGYFAFGTGVKARSGLASVNAATGALEPYFGVQLTGHHAFGRFANSANGPVGANSIAVSPDRKRAIVDGNFLHATDGVTTYGRDQIVSINLTTPAANVDPNWNSLAYSAACYNWAYDSYMRDIGWSPDGKFFVVTATGGYYGGSFEDCDSASRFEAAATGTDVQPTWKQFTGTDSLYSVVVTTSAVYVGGHQRWMNNPYGQDNPGPGAVPRPGLAALDPANGVPLSWNPGRLRGHGAEVIYATTSGIWVGSDTDYVGNYAYRHQKLAFFPLAGGTAAAGNNVGNPGRVFLADSTFSANTFNASTGAGSPITPNTFTGGGISWDSVRGAFMLNGRIWYGSSDGHFYYRNYNGANTFGPAMLVDPYNDPYWSNVQTGSGQTYRGTPTAFGAEIPNVTGMFYANRSIYYTLPGDGRLYRRDFAPDTAVSSVAGQVTGGIISPVEVVVSDPTGGAGVPDLSNAGGMFVANGILWYADRTTGQLFGASWNGKAPTSAGVLDAAASGNWTARGVFLSPT